MENDDKKLDERKTERRREEALKRMLSTPHKPHNPQPKADKRPRKPRAKSKSAHKP